MAYDDRTIFVRIHGLRRVSVASTILFSAELYKFSESWDRSPQTHRRWHSHQDTLTLRSSHSLCTGIARFTYDWREYVTVTEQKSHDLPTTPVQSLHDLRTDSVRLCLWPFYDAQYHEIARMTVNNVNVNIVARSHLRCPQNRKENRRLIHHTMTVANVN